MRQEEDALGMGRTADFSRVIWGKKVSAPGVIRTPDLWIRSPSLYPAELRARILLSTTYDTELSLLLRLVSK